MSATAIGRRRKRDLFAGILLQPPWLLSAEFAAGFLIVIVLLTVPLTRNATSLAREQFERSLGTLAMTAAALVDGDAHDRLRTSGDELGAEYQRLLEPLARFQNAAHGIRNLYTLRMQGGALVFVLDTARSPVLRRETDAASPFLGKLDFELAQEPDMMPTVLAGKPYVDRAAYRSNSTGRVMHAVEAPIRTADGRVVGILAVEYDEQQFNERLTERRGRVLGLALLIDLTLVGTIAALVYWLRSKIGDALAALECEARTDALTGLYNRRHFNRLLHTEIARAVQRKETLSLLIVDADRFKRINDMHGHAAGDAVLVHIAACLRTHLDASQRGFRIGGEEFAVILRRADSAAAMALFQRVSAAIRQPLDFDGARLEVTVSGGVAQLRPGEAGDQLLGRADQALYEAKKGGRDLAVSADGA